jgi:2,4-dienoyl-CoA reductase-like NADH-dependent reductase (Old Yellow Enzyme family)
MAAKTKYKKLLEPGYIGALRTKNRIVRMGAFPEFTAWEDGFMHQYYFDFNTALTEGGVGLITVSISLVGAPPGRCYMLDDDKYIPRMHELSKEIDKYGCPTLIS